MARVGFNYMAFENLDNENLDMALGAYKCFPEACKAHMLKTILFKWNLPNHAAFREAFPEDAAELDSAHASYVKGVPPHEETMLSGNERDVLALGKFSDESCAVLDKIAADPKYDDVLAVLTSGRQPFDAEVVRAYTPAVHAQLVALREPLKALIHDVNDKREALLKPPVRAIGIELHELGGKKAQEAVYCAIVMLLSGEVSHCDDGDVWSDARSSLNIAWDGCGEWRS